MLFLFGPGKAGLGPALRQPLMAGTLFKKPRFGRSRGGATAYPLTPAAAPTSKRRATKKSMSTDFHFRIDAANENDSIGAVDRPHHFLQFRFRSSSSRKNHRVSFELFENLSRSPHLLLSLRSMKRAATLAAVQEET
jgi:hypothetical protein